MSIEDWARRLDLFLEFEKYRVVQEQLFESDFDRVIKQLEQEKDDSE